MSEIRYKEFTYRCQDDCIQYKKLMDCPGHTLQLIDDFANDTIIVLRDGVEYVRFNHEEWDALLKAIENLK